MAALRSISALRLDLLCHQPRLLAQLAPSLIRAEEAIHEIDLIAYRELCETA